jgi:L-amino acid N-acyltransferase YncA
MVHAGPDTRGQLVIRPAAPSDADALATIYNEGIADRQATFETAERTAADALTWLGRIREPVLAAEHGGRVAGFARVIASSDRCAYAGVGEFSIYLARDARGHGVGGQLLEALVSTAEDEGYWKLIGKLFTTNAASLALARRCGFREVGVHRRHARLDGEWKDVLVVERLLGDARATVLFVCLHNAGRSQMSAALFERAAGGRHKALSAGTTPADRVHPEVVEVMAELDVDLSGRRPQKLTRELAEQADVVVTMGCGDECPYIPGKRYVDWELEDPKGRPLEEVRAARDEITRRVTELVAELAE